MVIKNQHIPLQVVALRQETPGYWSVFFERPPGFEFDAGDWIDINFGKHSYKGGITYSLSSAPTEPTLRITFKHGVSEVKHALQNLQPKDELYVSQYGNDYDFTLKQNRTHMLIAGGVGVAPFRSMLKEMHDTSNRDDVTLLYLNQTEDFLFKDEFDSWAAANNTMRVLYIMTKGLNRKKRTQHVLSCIRHTAYDFYISGPPAMVETYEHLLVDNGVSIRNIRIDSFGGYE
jgi:ferredoxin-NADP reductase